MSGHSSLPRSGAVYVATVVAVGLTVALFSTVALASDALRLKGDFYQWYLLAALTLLSASVTINRVPATFHLETFVFTDVITYGTSAVASLWRWTLSHLVWPTVAELHRVL